MTYCPSSLRTKKSSHIFSSHTAGELSWQMQVLDMYQEARAQTPERWSISIKARRHKIPWNEFLEERDIWVRLRRWWGEEAYVEFRRDCGCPSRKHTVNARPHSGAAHTQHKLWVSPYRSPGSTCTNTKTHVKSMKACGNQQEKFKSIQFRITKLWQ